MSIYDNLGVATVINAAGTLTRLGSSRMAPEVLEAMREAAGSFVALDELQARVGERIARITGAEAGYVASGAAAGLTLATAACIARLDVSQMERLPQLTGPRYEVVVQRGHRNDYDHAIRATGVALVEVGTLGHPGSGGTHPWQIEAAISDRTVAIACPIIDTPGTVPLADVCRIAHAADLPVIVDAAAELPPRDNLRRFVREGADLVVFSGGKAIGGPQSSGILTGRRELIESVGLQHQDMDVHPRTWSQRAMIESGTLGGVPIQGIGRSMKVGREEIVGLIVALERFASGSDEDDIARWSRVLDAARAAIGDVAGLALHDERSPGRAPKLWVEVDTAALGRDAFDLINELLSGTPAIAAAQSRAELGMIGIAPHGLTEDEARQVGARIRELAAD